MESSALNKAHQQHRRAEAHLRHRKYQEAIECHRKAAEHLNEALTLTDNPRSLESIKLQRDFHLRQKEMILIKKEQFENYRKAIENKRNRVNSFCTEDFKDTHDNEGTSLQVAIYKTMEEADSLLGYLIKRSSGGNSDTESLKSFSTTDTDDKPLIDTVDSVNDLKDVTPIGCKHPKDQTTVVEELKTLNEQLHGLVYKLVTQLDSSTREIELLKERIRQLEGDKQHKDTSIYRQRKLHYQPKPNNNLKVVTDSSGGTSPFVFSPCSELSPDVHESRVLPALAPLELPNFDFTTFVKNNSHSLSTGN